MVSIEEIQAVYYMVAATGVLVAAGYYILNLKVSQKNQELVLKAQQQSLETRQIQILKELNADISDSPARASWAFWGTDRKCALRLDEF